MSIDRRTLLAWLSAALVAPRSAKAASGTDDAGRSIAIRQKVERIFPAGPPASILLYTFAPDLLLGWTRRPEPAECEFLDAGACDKPTVGRLTGRGNTTNIEVLLQLKPDLILDLGTINDTYISLAHRVYLLRQGVRIAEGATCAILTRDELEALYGAAVELIADRDNGWTAFLPG